MGEIDPVPNDQSDTVIASISEANEASAASDEFTDTTQTTFLNATGNVDEIIEGLSTRGWGRWFAIIVAILGLGNAGDAVEVSCVRYLLTAYRNSEGGPITAAQGEFLGAAVFVGMLLGGALCGIISDRLGRRPCFLAALGTAAFSGILCSVVPTVELLIITRIFAGVGIGGTIPVTFTLCMELTPPSKRGFYINVVAWNWMTGSLYVALSAWAMLGNLEESQNVENGLDEVSTSLWRWFAFVCALPATVAFVLAVVFVPETPQFLENRGRVHDAADVLRKMAAGCGRSGTEQFMQQVAALQASDKRKQQLEEASFPPSATTGSCTTWCWQLIAHTSDNFKAFFTPPLVRITVCLCVIWFCLSYGFYGISTWITKLFQILGLQHAYFNSLMFAAAQLPGNIVAAALIDRVERKLLLGLSLVSSTVFSLLLAFGTKELVVFGACVFNAVGTICWNTLDCVSVEYFPTRMRATAYGLLASAGRLGSILAQFVNGALSGLHITMLVSITTVIMFVGGLVSFKLPPTLVVTKTNENND